jgi:intracellular septation protein A
MKTKKQYIEVEKIDWAPISILLIGVFFIFMGVMGIYEIYILETEEIVNFLMINLIITIFIGLIILMLSLELEFKKI